MLTFIASIVAGTWGALQAGVHSQPTYIVITFFVLLFAGVLGIVNFLWMLWDRWQGRLALNPNELIHPPSNGVLWRWNPEVAADGPFCPKHPQKRLFLSSKHGREKWKDFERDYLSFNWFTCPMNRSEDFKFPEQPPLRVYQLRAQATAQFRAMQEQQDLTTPSEKEENTESLLKIEQTYSEITWKSILGGEFYPFSYEDRVPHNAELFLQIRAKITATPPRLIEEIWLELTGERVHEGDWAPERINDQREVYLRFKLPASISQGKQSAQLIIKALGANRRVIEKRSQSFEVVIARSYSDLQKFSDTSHQETADLKSKTKDSPPLPPGLFVIELQDKELFWSEQGKSELGYFHPEVTVPENATLTLQIQAKITALPRRHVENIQLKLTGQHAPLFAQEWKPQIISQWNDLFLHFRVPSFIPNGKYSATLIATIKEEDLAVSMRSPPFDIILTRSYNDLPRRKS